MTRKVYVPGLIVLLSAICLASIASAQTSWWRTYGGAHADGSYSVQQTTDGGYIIAAHTCSFGAGSDDVYLIKASTSGDTLWTRTYGGSNEDGFGGSSVQQTTDGGYIIASNTHSLGAGNGDVYLIKTNAQGDTVWTRTYGGTSVDEGFSVQQTTDGGYIVTGRTYSFGPGTPGGYANVYLIKTDASGDTLWARTYGGTNSDGGNSVQQTADGGFIIAGFTSSFGAGGADVYLIKTNAQGDTLWTRTYGGTRLDAAGSIQLTSDGGYIIAGWTLSFGAGSMDVYLIKTNASGEALWTRTYGGTDSDYGYSVRQAGDGGYVITGSTESFGAGTPGRYNVYLIKTDASGDTLWTRIYGGTSDDWGYSVQQTTDGGYIVAGYNCSFGAGGADVYLIKTDANGNVGIEEPLTRRPASPTRFLVQPNPFTSFSRVPGHETELFVLSDVTGRQVVICKGDRVGEGLRSGVYFLSPVGLKAGNAATATVVKTAF